MRIQIRVGRILPAVIVMALCGLTLTMLGPAAGAAQGANLLRNPGFEGTYSTWWDGNTPYVTAQMAPDWNPWWVRQSASDPSWKNRMPEWKPAAPFTNRIRSGSNAQQYFTFYGTHIAGVWQRVAVTPGTPLRFSIWMMIWSSGQDDPAVSNPDGEVDAWVGIDPTGGTDPLSATVVWSASQRRYDQWFQMSVQATASSNNVTVFVRTAPTFPVKHNDVYLDDAELVAVGAQPSTATPTSEQFQTATPTTVAPTQPGEPSPTASPTATPIPTGSIVHTVVAGDSLWALAARYGTTVSAIMSANGLTSSLIRVGQQLVIPTTLVQPTAPPPATAIPPTAIPGEPATGTYVVQRGDNLFRIALRFGTTVEALARLNGIVNPNLIRVGQVLQVTGDPGQPPPPPPPAQRVHVVQRGENAFRIALRYGTTVEALAALNGIANPNLIYAGQVLRIP